MEILSEWYRDNDVTFLGKPGYGRMDQDHGMGWHGNRSQACLRTSLARIYVRTALIYATRQEWICQITQGLSIALKTGAELKAHPPAPCWSSSTVDCTDKLRQKKKKKLQKWRRWRALMEVSRGGGDSCASCACVRERVGLDGVGFSPPNLTEHHHSDHSNSPVRIIIITTLLLLLIIFPIILAAEEGKPRRGKKGSPNKQRHVWRLGEWNFFNFFRIKTSCRRLGWACSATVRFTKN